MRTQKNFLVLFSTILLFGCTTVTVKVQPEISAIPDEKYSYVDLALIDQAKYRKDYAECAIIANQTPENNDQIVGNTVNRVLDRLTMGILGNNISKDADRTTVLKRCLTGRGYNILR
jgi:hypothetical protein